MALDQPRNWLQAMVDNLEQVKRRGMHPLHRRHHPSPQQEPSAGDKTALNRTALNRTAPTKTAPHKTSLNRTAPTTTAPPKTAPKTGATPRPSTARTSTARTWTTPPVYLPDEMIVEMLHFVALSRDAQPTLASCCLISRQWHRAAAPFLYARPCLTAANFDAFYRVICPTKNRHIQESPYQDMLKVLDMSQLVHPGSKSVTGQMLGRARENLEEFVAPQATFSIYSFPALSKCRKLRVLDLSNVSDSPPLLELFKIVARMDRLATLRLPRCAGFINIDFDAATMSWPPNLEHLCLSGGVDVKFLNVVVTFPATLRSLTIEHCPGAKAHAILYLLRTAVRQLPNLESLKLAYLAKLSHSSLDDVLHILPGLTELSISADYISPALFDLKRPGLPRRSPETWSLEPPSARHSWTADNYCQLTQLELTSSGSPGVEERITPIDVMTCVQDGTLPHLKRVRVAKSLFWHSEQNAKKTRALADALARSAAKQKLPVDNTGVWSFDG